MDKIRLPTRRGFFSRSWKQILLFLSVFGPATITAMADNDASGVATYAVAGARLGYPILFLLLIVTILLGITQEMGIRLTVVTRKGLADLIRERFGVKASTFIFAALFIANLGILVVDAAAVEVTAQLFHIPTAPAVIVVIAIAYIVVVKGNYKFTQYFMLIACLFFLVYIVSALKAQPDWGLAFSNLLYPHGVTWDAKYTRDFLVIGMGVLGTTVTSWGQFFISSFSSDKKIEKGKVNYSQLETYWGAFLTDFFSFFMIVATAATLYVNHIALTDGAAAAKAIEPFAGHLAGTLFAVGILNAGFMGLVVVSLSTAYAFAEFFGVSGSLDDDFKKSKTFYIMYLFQLILAGGIVLFPQVSLFNIIIATQVISAFTLPPIFYYLIRFTSDKKLMGEFVNNAFQKYFSIACTILIAIASLFTLATLFIKF
ncbi:MAG TPA: divalent metal cation transporter [Anaerolineales bacterium]|nr:divalent metal cation transporter [Anaerolineales bacterium]